VAKLVDGPELDRLRRTGLGAGRLEAALQPVVAQRALLRRARDRVHLDDAEGTGGDAVAAAVAGIRLDDDGIELGPDDRAGRTHFEAAGLDAMLADVAHQEPSPVAAVFGELLDELDVTSVDPVEPARVVVAVAAQRVEAAVGARQLVPLLARDFARFAADTDGRVGVEAHRLRHPTSPSSLFHVAHEGLSLVNRHVRIADQRGQLVHDVAAGEALVAPVPRHADLVHDLAVDGERTQATGDQRLRADLAARARDRDPVEIRDLLFPGELGTELDEELRLELG